MAKRSRRPGTSWPWQLSGSPRDNQSHAIARTAFLNHICRVDPKVATLFQWGGVLAAADALAADGDRLAARAGLAHRGELFAADYLAPNDEAAFLADGSAWLEACHRFFDVQQVSLFGAAADHFVRHVWSLDWPWLSIELFNIFVHRVVATICDLEVNVAYEVEPVLPVLRFTTDVNEAPADYIRRLTRHLREMSARTLDRHGIRPNETTIQRDVEWFYRATLQEPHATISALAREYYAHHPQPTSLSETEPRATVRTGIARARHLLADVPRFRYATEKAPPA